MRCSCCAIETSQVRKVKIRPFQWPNFNPLNADTAAYHAYSEGSSYRWSFICQACYTILDNYIGLDHIDGRPFNMSGVSRRGKATTLDETKYERFLRKEIARLGSTVSTWLRWEGGTVHKLAQGISNAATFEELPYLADALEDAGCTDTTLLTHCRFVGQHFRASWVLDLLLLAANDSEHAEKQAG